LHQCHCLCPLYLHTITKPTPAAAAVDAAATAAAGLQFNAGSALAAGTLTALAFFNTLCAAASAMLTWVLMDNLRGHKLRATGVCVGLVVGLIAITPAAGGWMGGKCVLVSRVYMVSCDSEHGCNRV
jgi:ammonia channel protein AmtB